MCKHPIWIIVIYGYFIVTETGKYIVLLNSALKYEFNMIFIYIVAKINTIIPDTFGFSKHHVAVLNPTFDF